MSDLETLMDELRNESWRWAVAWNGTAYLAVVSHDSKYIGDDLVGPWGATGASALEALRNARRERDEAHL